MPTVEVNEPPYLGQLTILQGRPFTALTIRLRDADGVAIPIDAQAHVCTEPVAVGGVQLAACEAVDVGDEGWNMVLSSAETRLLPASTLVLEALYKRTGEEWQTAGIIEVTVIPETSLPVVALDITGDTTIGVGDITSLTATATFDDDSTEDVTTQCAWTNAPSAHAEVLYGHGFVIGRDAGTTSVTAALGTVTDTASVTVS